MLYVTDSVHGGIRRVPARGVQATVRAAGEALEPSTQPALGTLPAFPGPVTRPCATGRAAPRGGFVSSCRGSRESDAVERACRQ